MTSPELIMVIALSRVHAYVLVRLFKRGGQAVDSSAIEIVLCRKYTLIFI